MLSGVAYNELFDCTLKPEETCGVDPVYQFLFRCVQTIPVDYFCARESAFCNPDAGVGYAILTRESYEFARGKMESAKSLYRENGDLDALLSIALPQVSYVLSHAAQWLGHRDGLPESEGSAEADSTADLATIGLKGWLQLIARDLSNLYSDPSGFNVQNIYALAQHAERLLWSFGICPWLRHDGQIYVSIPEGKVVTNC